MKTLASSAFLLAAVPGAAAPLTALAQDGGPTFTRQVLSREFHCEGASFGDFDRDGRGDVVAGPYWYEGPDFTDKHEIYPPKTFDPLRYSDNFFAFPYDFDGDGWLDVLFVGFPGQEAAWYRNPAGAPSHWPRHVIFQGVDNEAPGFGDLTGDGRPELYFHHGGRFGWAGPDWSDPAKPWVFHPISENLGLPVFVHGLGLGDVDGDGRPDLLEKDGWWRQPASLSGDPPWTRHPFPFSTARGGAQMYAYDVDGDGDQDVLTSLDGHGYGLSWFEQTRTDGAISFAEHRILGAKAADSPYGVVFSQLHALDLADVNGDGLKDLVTGKRHWAHGPTGDPGAEDPAVLYWFELRRGPAGAEFVPHLIDSDSGAGVQVVAGDVNGDGAADVVAANKKGSFVFLQRRPAGGGIRPRDGGGRLLNLDFESGGLQDWTAAGDAFADQPIAGDTVAPRRGDMHSDHQGDYWVGGYERHGDGRTGTLSSAPFPVAHPYASFLVGGGGHRATRVELVRAADQQVLFQTPGANHETLQRVVADLRPFLHQEIFIRLVDEHQGGWGHLNFDDFLFHAEPPPLQRPAGVPEIHPYRTLQETGFAPAAAARAMTVPAGFAVHVVAAEPDLHQPIALDIDARGRLWVAEAHSYPVRRPEGQGQDQILVFEDGDGDGVFETRTVFASGLNLVSGLAVGFGGVWVGAAPYLLFLPDAGGDLVPDGPPQILLDGWGYQDTHETLNAFLWGPDGWLYGCHGVFTHSKVGKPGASDAERTPLNAGVWRYHPTRHEFEVFAWGTSNPWGVDFDDHGQAFLTACVIPHLYHVIQGGRYERQGGRHFDPYFYDDLKTIADHRHYQGDAAEHAWWGRNEPVAHAATDQAGGGHAHCGAMIYLGDNFPPEYRNSLFMSNIHGNRFNRDLLARNGSGFTGRHAPDFLLANDQWFRGVNLKYGPDGGVYFIDWYDRQACHRTDVELWDRSNGRLYHVAYGAPRPVRAALDGLSDLELVDLQLHPNDWYVRTARRILQERGGSAAVHAALREILDQQREAPRRLRALWALHVSGGLDEEFGLALLDDREESVQAWTVQLLLEQRRVAPRLRDKLAELARGSASPLVRLYLASALQRMPLAERWELGTALAARSEDAGDPNLPLMIWYGVEPLVAGDPPRALAMARQARIPLLARFLVRRAAVEEAGRASLVAAMKEAGDPAWLRLLLEETRKALEEQRNVPMPAGWPQVYAVLAQAQDESIREQALAVAVAFGDATAFTGLRAVVADRLAPAERRRLALAALLRGKDPQLSAVLRRLLADAELRLDALRALAAFDDPETPPAVLAIYGQLGLSERRAALSTLTSRSSYAVALLQAVRSGRVPRGDFDALLLRQLRQIQSPEVDERLAEIWGVMRETSVDKVAEIQRWKDRLTPESLAAADLPRGRAAFARTCEQCHTLFGRGGDVGPDLTGSNRADLDYVLSNLIDPNAVIAKEYQVTVVQTHGERIVSGILAGENADTVTLKNQDGLITVDRADVAVIEPSAVSMMPEDLVLDFREDDFRDLIAYLASQIQVPLRATKENQSRLFNGRDLTGWSGDPACWSVEGGEIVGRSAGLEHNEFLRSELELGDFRLVVEVKLAGEEGNSGIQFRSRELAGGDVAGYQADVGPGWWGMLYEEHGRGVLAGEPGAIPLRAGDWNVYEILAAGRRIRTAINGHPCVDLEDAGGALRGILALQIHSGGPTEVRFRNLQLELDPQPVLRTVPASGR